MAQALRGGMCEGGFIVTIVELYDDKPINNVVGTLAFSPDKVIYVGGNTRKHFDKKHLPVLRKYFNAKGYGSLEIEYVQVRRDSLKDIVDKFEEIYASDRDCKFLVEITGGEDQILIGMGVLSERHPDTELYRVSSKLRTVSSYSVREETGKKRELECLNTVEENLMLHGASIVSCNGSDMIEGGFRWNIEFLNDVNEMWNICCHGADRTSGGAAPHHWNKAANLMAELESAYEQREDKLTLAVDKHYYNEVFLDDGTDAFFHKYIVCFMSNGLIDYTVEKDKVIIRFKNEQVRLLLTRAGLLLELKIYLIVMGLVNARGGDCLTGVTIDWDGEDDIGSAVKYLADPEDPSSKIDTLNEVDVAATCGLVPYFISCKNGRFTSDELYKLYSVGERFGKGYGKKIIAASNLDYALGGGKNLILQRAADMGICVIDDLYLKTDDEIAEDLRQVMELPKVKQTN